MSLTEEDSVPLLPSSGSSRDYRLKTQVQRLYAHSQLLKLSTREKEKVRLALFVSVINRRVALLGSHDPELLVTLG